MLKRADLVFATAQTLLETAEHFNPNVHLVPNGVDAAAYGQALLSETVVPSDVADLDKPVIGLVGAINAKVDVRLLEALAAAHPEWSIVLVGPVAPSQLSTRALRTLPNIHLLGYRDPASLPAYLKAIDVALIPYVLDARTRAINPLKAYEYLAAGKPVVATALPELRRFESVIRIATGSADFVGQVEAALNRNDPQSTRRRVEAVNEHTWDRRIATMADLIQATV